MIGRGLYPPPIPDEDLRRLEDGARMMLELFEVTSEIDPQLARESLKEDIRVAYLILRFIGMLRGRRS